MSGTGATHRDTEERQVYREELVAGESSSSGWKKRKVCERERELNYIESLEPLRIVCSIRFAF